MVVRIPKNLFTVEAARAYIPLTDKKVSDANVIKSAQAKFLSETIRKGATYGAINGHLIVAVLRMEQVNTTQLEIHDELVSGLVSAAAEATEVCSEDELERHAAKQSPPTGESTAEAG